MDANICRLCLSKNELIPIFQIKTDSDENIQDMVNITCGVEILETDEITQMICRTCHQIALRMYSFRKTAIKNDNLLKTRHVKKGLVENEENTKVSTSPEPAQESVKLQKEAPIVTIGAPTNSIHSSLQLITKQYPNITLPRNIQLNDNYGPCITLLTNEVERHLEVVNVKPEKKSKKRLKSKLYEDNSIANEIADKKIKLNKNFKENEISDNYKISGNISQLTTNAQLLGNTADNQAVKVNGKVQGDKCTVEEKDVNDTLINEESSKDDNKLINSSLRALLMKDKLPKNVPLVGKTEISKKVNVKNKTTKVTILTNLLVNGISKTPVNKHLKHSEGGSRGSVNDSDKDVHTLKNVTEIETTDNFSNKPNSSKKLDIVSTVNDTSDKASDEINSLFENANLTITSIEQILHKNGETQIENQIAESNIPIDVLSDDASKSSDNTIQWEKDQAVLQKKSHFINSLMLMPTNTVNPIKKSESLFLSHINKSRKLYSCRVCNTFYNSPKELKIHQRKNHTKCPFCNKKFPSIQSKDNHNMIECHKKAMRKMNNMKLCLVRVDEDLEIRKKYPSAFDELTTETSKNERTVLNIGKINKLLERMKKPDENFLKSIKSTPITAKKVPLLDTDIYSIINKVIENDLESSLILSTEVTKIPDQTTSTTTLNNNASEKPILQETSSMQTETSLAHDLEPILPSPVPITFSINPTTTAQSVIEMISTTPEPIIPEVFKAFEGVNEVAVAASNSVKPTLQSTSIQSQSSPVMNNNGFIYISDDEETPANKTNSVEKISIRCNKYLKNLSDDGAILKTLLMDVYNMKNPRPKENNYKIEATQSLKQKKLLNHGKILAEDNIPINITFAKDLEIIQHHQPSSVVPKYDNKALWTNLTPITIKKTNTLSFPFVKPSSTPSLNASILAYKPAPAGSYSMTNTLQQIQVHSQTINFTSTAYPTLITNEKSTTPIGGLIFLPVVQQQQHYYKSPSNGAISTVTSQSLNASSNDKILLEAPPKIRVKNIKDLS